MSHGECDDWWDFFDCPIWVARYLDEIGVVSMDGANSIEEKIELREVVHKHYALMKKHKADYLYEGVASLNNL